MDWLHIVYSVAALIVIATALERLEYCTPAARGLCWRQRVTDTLCALAWASLALGVVVSVGSAAWPALDGGAWRPIGAAELLTTVGVALLAVHVRLVRRT